MQKIISSRALFRLKLTALVSFSSFAVQSEGIQGIHRF